MSLFQQGSLVLSFTDLAISNAYLALSRACKSTEPAGHEILREINIPVTQGLSS